jgi:hypothetical protein
MVERIGADKFLESHIQRHWRSFFFEKHTDWAQELEYRWLIQANGDEAVFIPVSDAIAGIALGEKFPREKKPSVGRFLLVVSA